MRRVLLLAAVLVLAGCNGGTVDRHALTNDAATIDSINCESWLLAKAVARNRVTAAYAREQAHALAEQSASFADALAHRPTAAGLEGRVRARARDAASLAARLRRLAQQPTDRDAADRLAGQFQQAGSCA